MSLKQMFHNFVDYLQTIMGVPNYHQYRTFMKKHHPNQPVQEKEEFYQHMMDAKYNRGKTNRCC